MPPDPSPTTARHCPHCGAALATTAARCWLCSADASIDSDLAVTQGTQREAGTSFQEPSFSLATLMFLVTFVAIICGAINIAPGAGIVLALVMLLALVRSTILADREEALGHAVGPAKNIVLFFGSLGVVVVAGVAAAIAFFALCFGGFFAGLGAARPEDYVSAFAGAILGGIIGAPLAAWILYRIVKAFSPKVTNKP